MAILKDSPFYILGATIHHSRREVVNLAEDKMLEVDEDLCINVRSELTNPKLRLKHEVAWLPKTNPRRIKELIRISEEEPLSITEFQSIPKLSQFNLLSSALHTLDSKTKRKQIVDLITSIGFISTRLFPADILSVINEERAVSGFPQIESSEDIESELTERLRECVNGIVSFLDRLPSRKLIRVMTDVAEISTIGGIRPACTLIDSLVDRYEIETTVHLETEATNIAKLIDIIKDSCKRGRNSKKCEQKIQSYITALEKVTVNWDMIAQPIQVSTKARGIEHRPSQEIAYTIRGLSVDLFNEYGMVSTTQRLTRLLSQVFAEVPDVAERVEEDEEALTDILQDRRSI